MYIVRYPEEYLNMFELDERFRVAKLRNEYYMLLTNFEYPIFYPEKDKKYYIRVIPEVVRIERVDKEFYHYLRIIVKEESKKTWYLFKIAQSEQAFFFLIKNLKRYVFDFELTLKSTHNGKGTKLQIIPIFKKEKENEQEKKIKQTGE